MSITLSKELEAALREEARLEGVAPEAIVLRTLNLQHLRKLPNELSGDELVRRLEAVAVDCGVVLSDEAVSSEGIYE